MLPAFIILVSLFFISSQLELLDDNKVYRLNDLSDISLYFKLGRNNVELSLDKKPDNAGFDVIQNDKKNGQYYILNNKDHLIILALTDKTAASLGSGSTDIRVRLVREEAISNYIETEYNEMLKLGPQTLNEYIDSIILSEVEFPAFRIFLIRLAKIVSIVLLGLLVAYLCISSIITANHYENKKKEESEEAEEYIESKESVNKDSVKKSR